MNPSHGAKAQNWAAFRYSGNPWTLSNHHAREITSHDLELNLSATEIFIDFANKGTVSPFIHLLSLQTAQLRASMANIQAAKQCLDVHSFVAFKIGRLQVSMLVSLDH